MIFPWSLEVENTGWDLSFLKCSYLPGKSGPGLDGGDQYGQIVFADFIDNAPVAHPGVALLAVMGQRFGNQRRIGVKGQCFDPLLHQPQGDRV